MTSPDWKDGLSIAGLVFNLYLYVTLVWRRKTRETLQEGQKEWKFQAMWEDFKDRKHIKAKNGGSH